MQHVVMRVLALAIVVSVAWLHSMMCFVTPVRELPSGRVDLRKATNLRTAPRFAIAPFSKYRHGESLVQSAATKRRSSAFLSILSAALVPFFRRRRKPRTFRQRLLTGIELYGGLLRDDPMRAVRLTMLYFERNNAFTNFFQELGRIFADRTASIPAGRKLVLRMSALKLCKIYLAMLVLRTTTMWFPNINPYQQPFYTFNQLTDPYLNAFKGWLPTVFGIDLSVTLAFAAMQAAIKALTKPGL